MLKYGGYSLLIATVATVAFFAVLQWAQDYVKEKTPELEIQLDDEGYLYVNYQYDDKENVYIPESNFYISNEIIVEFIRGEVV